MKYFLLLLSIGFLVTACNRPILQPPLTPTSPARLVTDTITAPTGTIAVLDSTSTQTSITPQIAAPSNNLPTHTLPPRLTTTPKLSSTPYPTPAWCPGDPAKPTTSGKLRVVYTSQGDLWLEDEGETGKQLSSSRDIKQVSLSDDGHIIAFTRQIDKNHQDLWTINADGGNEHRLISIEELVKMDGNKDALGVIPVGFQWEPGKHRFTFYTYPIFDGIWIFEPSKVWLADTDSGEISLAPYQGGYLSYSPDGTQVAIYNKNGINLAYLDGSYLRENVLPGYHGIGEGESYFDPKPHWALDSSSILVALPDEDDMYTNEAEMTIWRVPVEGKPNVLGTWNAFAPSVSFPPDQRFISFWLWPAGAANQRELHISSLNTKGGEQLLAVAYIQGELLENLDWSPDSQHFFIGMVGINGPSQLYLGHICQRPVLLKEFDIPGSFNPTWIDSSRYLLTIAESTSDETLELRLGQIGQTEMDTLGVVSAYDWVLLP